MIENLIRAHLKSFQPYTSARSEVQQAKIFLDANELSIGSPVEFDGISLNRYPDPFQLELRKTLAQLLEINMEMIFTGVGSDEVIDLLIRLFCEPGNDSIAILEPTYGMYRVAANLSAVQVTTIELDDNFQIDLERTLNNINPTTKLVFLCSPNNPTGNLLKRDDILKLCTSLNSIIVVDQAYIEFADGNGDMVQDVSHHENLVVLRTLSKAWGLAGIRLGYCIANPTIVSHLMRVKAPYNINGITSQIALIAMGNSQFLTDSTQLIKQERTLLIKLLKMYPGVVKIYHSDANFILIEFENANKVYEGLAQKGIIVRRRSEKRLSNCLRFTVGTTDENNILLETLGKIS